MIIEELRKWRSELLANQKKELDAVSEKYKRKLEAIDVLLEGHVPPPRKLTPPTRESVGLGDEYRKNITKLSATREAVGHFKSERFTTAKLFGYVKQKYPQLAEKPSDLSNSVWILKKSEDIKTVKEGAGPESPPEYIVTENFHFP